MQLIDSSFWESQVVYDKDWRYASRSEPETLWEFFNFYPSQSHTIQQAESKIEEEQFVCLLLQCIVRKASIV